MIVVEPFKNLNIEELVRYYASIFSLGNVSEKKARKTACLCCSEMAVFVKHLLSYTIPAVAIRFYLGKFLCIGKKNCTSIII